MTFKFDGWPRKTIWRLFYTTWSFEHRLKAIDEFKLKSYSPKMLNSGQNRLFVVQRDLEIWWMTLENNKEAFLNWTKLCASFQSHGSYRLEMLNSGQKRFFFLRDLEIWQMTLENDRASPLCYSFVHHFKAIGEFKLELQSGNSIFWSTSFF